MSERVPFAVRPATVDDIDRLTELHLANFTPDEHALLLLGERFLRCTYRWLVTSGESYIVVAEHDGLLIALNAVCDGPYAKSLLLSCIGELFLCCARNPLLMFRKVLWGRLIRRRRLSGHWRKVESYPGIARMWFGTVDSRFRGQEVITELIKAVKDHSRERGSRALLTGAYRENTPAHRVLRKTGWIELPELATPETIVFVTYLDPELPAELGLPPES